MPLKPTQRIKLIKEIAERLSGEGWSLIDLTLEQFGLPISPTWSGNEYAYLVEHVSKGTMSSLWSSVSTSATKWRSLVAQRLQTHLFGNPA